MNIWRIIFWFLLLITFLALGLMIMDTLKGDGNGIVAGINFGSIVKYLIYSSLIYSVWYAFKHHIAWLQNTLMLGMMMILTIVLLEWICGIVLKKQTEIAPKIDGPKHSMIFDEHLGYKPKPDTMHTGIRTVSGKIIYSINFNTDTNGLRITPADSSETRTKYAQFYGCSMTFGEGVQSNETLPYYFGKLKNTYRPYNFAYSGYGPHQMLARLETGSPKNIVRESTGIGFYIYIDDHVNRAIGTMTNYGYNGGFAPYFHKVGNELKHDGLFKNARKIRSWFYEAMLKSNILKLFKIGYPFRISEVDYELTAEIMAQASRDYKKQFNNDNFYVIIYPTTVDSSLIVSLLKNKGVKVLDYSKLFNPTEKKYSIPYDEHPTALANETLIKELVKDIK